MTKITAVNVNNEGDGYLLFGNDDIRVDVGVSVISTGASAIACWEGAHVFRIFGTLHGEDDGLKMLGTAETCKVVIAETARITSGGLGLYTHSNGVVLDGLNTTMFNAGQIDAANAAIWAMIRDGGTTRITNTGEMQGVNYGIYAPFGTGTMAFTNRGTLEGAIAIFGAPGIDLITNRGTITGTLDLREGDDVVVTRGALTGLVDLGAGNDSYTDRRALGQNHDHVTAGLGDDTVLSGNGNDTLLGGEGSDSLNGGAGDDRISGGDEADTLVSGTGVDTLYGGAGDDLLDDAIGSLTRSGTMLAYGGDGDDRLHSGRGHDTLCGGAGDDLLVANAGDDRLNGGTGNDTLRAGEGQDTIAETAEASGHDLIYAGGGADSVAAGSGADTIWGEGGADFLRGEAGDDLLLGGLGADTLTGGAGADSFAFHSLRERGDTITDFDSSLDRLEFDAAAFGYGSQTGRVAAADCVTGTAQDASDHWIYDSAARTLSFDADGNGRGKALVFASFEGGMDGWNIWLT